MQQLPAVAEDLHCPLCRNSNRDAMDASYSADSSRRYAQCQECHIVFVPKAFHLDPSAERARYCTHKNGPTEPGYVAFLTRASQPLVTVIASRICSIVTSDVQRLLDSSSEAAMVIDKARRHVEVEQSSGRDVRWSGLDFGCGPGPTLNLLLERSKLVASVALYDRFFSDDDSVLFCAAGGGSKSLQLYDFITATEVVEHLAECGDELDRLWHMLRPGGLLLLMTQQLVSRSDFAKWWYKRDPTHICFFDRDTFLFLRRRWGDEVDHVWFVGSDVVIFARR